MKLHLLFIVPLAITVSGVTAPAQESQTAPASVGIVFDTSGSMAFKLAWERQVLSGVLNSATSLDDEFTFIQASDRPIARTGFVSAPSVMESLLFTQAKGRSALLDGIYLGLQLMKMAHNERKVLLVVSDGMDNASRYTETEIASALRETGVRIYTIALTEPGAVSELFNRIAQRGHSRHFSVESCPVAPNGDGTQQRYASGTVS